MPDLSLNNVETLSYRRSMIFAGDIFSYNSTDFYTVKARETGDSRLISIQPAWAGLSGHNKTGLNYLNFIINGVTLGSGKVTSFNWEEGNDIQNKKFTMSFEIASTGDLYNMTGTSYAEIDKNIFTGDFKYVNNLTEDLSISIANNGIEEYNQNVSFGIDKPLSDVSKIALKNKLFSGFSQYRIPNMGVRIAKPLVATTSDTLGYITYYTETADIYNSKYSFSKKYSYDGNYQATWEYSHSLQFDGNDATVSENGSIKSIYFYGTEIHKNLSGARSRWSTIQTDIFSRATQTLNSVSGFTGVLGSGLSLIPVVISKNIKEDPLEGVIDYSYVYTTNPQYTASGFIFSNERSSSIDSDGYYSVSENGEYRGMSDDNETRFGLAYSGYLSGASAVFPRVSGAFFLASRLNSLLCRPTGNFYLTNENKTFREFDGIVGYNNVYSNNPSYYPTGSNFVRVTNTITDTPPVHLYNKFLVPREDEYIQSASQSTEGSWTNNIKLIGKTGLVINDYLTETYTKVVKPSGSGMLLRFLKSMDYSFNPFENTFESNWEYYYSLYKEPGDTSV